MSSFLFNFSKKIFGNADFRGNHYPIRGVYANISMKGAIAMQKFSTRLIALRKERSMTQAELAKAINKTRSTVSGYETENKEPDYESLCVLADYFGVTVDYLLGRDDRKTHSDVVFVNDTQNFKRHYDNLPAPLRQTVAKLYDTFYVLLSRDMRFQNEERLDLYGELFSILQENRSAIRNKIEACGGEVQDALLLSDLMALQNTLKGDVSSCLDKLLQADIDTAFEVKKDALGLSERKATS